MPRTISSLLLHFPCPGATNVPWLQVGTPEQGLHSRGWFSYQTWGSSWHTWTSMPYIVSPKNEYRWELNFENKMCFNKHWLPIYSKCVYILEEHPKCTHKPEHTGLASLLSCIIHPVYEKLYTLEVKEHFLRQCLFFI